MNTKKLPAWFALLLCLSLVMSLIACGGPAATNTPTVPPEGTPTEAEATPTEAGSTPTEGQATPTEGGTTPTEGEVTPTEGEVSPTGETTPTGGVTPTSGVTPTGGATPTPGVYDPYAKMPASLSGTTIRTLWWYTPTADQIELHDNFTAKTGIKVRTVVTTYDGYQTKLAAMIAAKDQLDTNLLYSPWYPTFITRNLQQPIEPYIDFDDPFWDLSTMDQFKWGGKYYGVSARDSSDMYVMFYNATMFKNQGRVTPRTLWRNKNWNWDTFLDAAKAMTSSHDPTDPQKVYGFETPKNACFMWSTGTDFASYTNDPKNPIVQNLTNPNVLKGWQLLVDLRNKYKYASGGSDVTLFTSGKCAMYAEGSWMMGPGEANPLNAMTDEWDAVPFPSPKGQEPRLAVSGKVWCIPIHSKNQLAAYYFFRYFLDSENGTGEPMSKELQQVFDAMLDMKKTSDVTQGLMPANDYWTLWSDIIYSADIKSTLDSWVPKLEAIIEQVINEIPKPD